MRIGCGPAEPLRGQVIPAFRGKDRPVRKNFRESCVPGLRLRGMTVAFLPEGLLCLIGIGRSVLLAVLLLSFAGTAHARNLPGEYTVQSWDLSGGLPDAPILAIQEGPDGYFWLTTQRGVVCFDGVRFVRLRGDDWVKAPLSDLHRFFMDPGGHAWLMCAGSVFQFDGRDWQEVPFAKGEGLLKTHLPSDPNPSAKREFFALGTDPDGRMLVASNLGVWRFDGKRLSLVPLPAGTPAVSAAEVDRRGDVWLAAGEGLLRFHGNAYSPEPLPEALKSGEIARIFPQADDVLWIQLSNERLFRRADGQWSEVPVSGLPVNSVVETGTGCWIGSADGVLLWQNGELIKFPGLAGNQFRNVRCMEYSRDGSLWIGTNDGLHRVQRRSVHMFPSETAPVRSVITALSTGSADGFWAGTKNRGLIHGDPEHLLPFASEPALGGPPISALLQSEDGKFWIGTGDGRLFRMDAAGPLTLISQEPDHLGFTCLLEDRKHQLWVGSRGGLFRLSEENRLVPVPDLPGPVLALNEGNDGTLRVGTSFDGLWELAPGSPSQAFRRAEGLPADMVSILQTDADGVLWIASPVGLARWAGGQKTFFTEEQGLPDSEIRQMLDDGRGNLWLGTRAGLCRVPKAELADLAAGRRKKVDVLNLDRNDGLTAQISGGSQAPLSGRSPDGRLWFCTRIGLAMVDPAWVRAPVPIGDVAVARMRVNGRNPETLRPLLSQKSVSNTEGAARRISLPPGTQNVEFFFSVADCSKKTLFRTFLEGRDTEWSPGFPDHRVVYAGMTKGNYRLRVMACNGDGVWREGSVPVKFSIRAYYWETWWFQAGVGIALVVLAGTAGALFVRHLANRRLRKVEQEQARNLATQKERTRIARDIHDDMGSSLTSITLLSQVPGGNPEIRSRTETNLRKIHDIARQLTRTMEEVVWAVNPKHDTFDGLVDYLGNYAQGFLRDAGVRCRLDIPISLPPCHLATDVRHNLFLAFKEALNNVVKHADANEVRISLIPGTSDFTLTVEDDGKGFSGQKKDAPTPTGGNGLPNMAARLREIGGTCEMAGKPGGGSKVTFIVPANIRS